MSNQWFHIIVSKQVIVKKRKENYYDKSFYYNLVDTERSINKKNILTSKKFRYFSCGKYLVIRCLRNVRMYVYVKVYKNG